MKEYGLSGYNVDSCVWELFLCLCPAKLVANISPPSALHNTNYDTTNSSPTSVLPPGDNRYPAITLMSLDFKLWQKNFPFIKSQEAKTDF